MQSNIIDLKKYRRKRSIEQILVTLNLKEIFYKKGKAFLIALLEHILKVLKEN